MRSPFLKVCILMSPMMLAACGDGWEAQKTTEYSPYGNQRTAGSGVVYVRKNLLPEKELKVELPAEQEAVVMHDEPKSLDAEKIFTESLGKGSHVEATSSMEKEKVVESSRHVEVPSAEKPMDLPQHHDESVPEGEVEKHSMNLLEYDGTPKFQNNTEELEALQPAAGEDEYVNNVVQPAEVVSMPVNEIVSPKKDFMLLSDEGKRSLAEIYDDNF